MFAGCYPLIVRSDQAELLAHAPNILPHRMPRAEIAVHNQNVAARRSARRGVGGARI
jgi:hypothetical protein